MSKVRIVNVPPGEAPEWVRREWVGLELPLSNEFDATTPRLQMGVVGGPVDPQNIGGYAVPKDEAIDILEKKNPTAAQWWRDESIIGTWLIFSPKVCLLID
ncbi:MAG: hypothetical protein A3E92_03170 [Candidatus Taylorbacteria bacterium RIFCSPHIGHO2_12_FULL_42_34]|nr:MAG: hypothetical protein A3E92_03170 [Candidatus Taylorbacteria bacterium RIFCSPHIGHO2_12_FULL_42_34]